jgi:hypothetical protein
MNLKKLPSLLILLTFFVASCSNPASSNQNTNIEIQITGTEPKVFAEETISQPNCTGTAEVENMVQRARTIEYIMETQNGVSINANGQVGFAGTDVELGATIASQFGQSYGTSETLTRSITVKAGIGTNMLHNIQQVEIWKVGQAKISVGGLETIIPFKFRSDFGIELANSQNLGNCDTLVTIPTISITPTQSPKSASEPSPTLEPEKIDTRVTQGGVSKNYSEILEDGEIIVGHADKFQSYEGCVAYLIAGPGDFNFSVKSGLWDKWINATPHLYESLLKEQSDTLINKYSCVPVKIVKCEPQCTESAP